MQNVDRTENLVDMFNRIVVPILKGDDNSKKNIALQKLVGIPDIKNVD